MKRSHILAAAAILICSAFAAAAQNIHEPAKGSAERKAILDAVRIPLERDIKQKLIFTTDHFSVGGNWAFVSGAPEKAGGGRPNYAGTRYQTAVDNGAFDNNFFALLKLSAGKWKVVKYAVGCTDVCYLDWPRTYRAPKAIFPMGE